MTDRIAMLELHTGRSKNCHCSISKCPSLLLQQLALSWSTFPRRVSLSINELSRLIFLVQLQQLFLSTISSNSCTRWKQFITEYTLDILIDVEQIVHVMYIALYCRYCSFTLPNDFSFGIVVTYLFFNPVTIFHNFF